jgi:outer membrane protein, multidrug efflux system
MRYFLLLLLPVVLASCRVGPDYRRPDCDMPANWSSTPDAEPVYEVDHQWWETFHDEQLTEYIYLAACNNKDIRTALANFCLARAERAGIASRLYPDIDAELRFNRNSFSTFFGGAGDINPENISTVTTNNEQEILFVGFDAIWELDFFGRTRRQVEAASYRIGSAIENYHDVLLTVIAETALNYVNARGLQEAIAIKEKEVEVLEQSIDLSRKLSKTGLASSIVLNDRQAELGMLRSELPRLYRDMYAAIFRLSVLTGRFPECVIEEMKAAKTLPELPPLMAAGLPSELLLRRPDIRRAETELAAATADVGVAVGDMYPRIFLGGSIGDQKFSTPTTIMDGFVWSYTVNLLTPFFKAGRIKANIRGEKAKAAQAFYAYENTILKAVEETENRITGYSQELNRLAFLEETLADTSESLELTHSLYERGVVNRVEDLEKERVQLQSRQAAVESRIEAFNQLIGLYKSLGGGWVALNSQSY